MFRAVSGGSPGMLRLAPDAPAVNNFSEQNPTISPKALVGFHCVESEKRARPPPGWSTTLTGTRHLVDGPKTPRGANPCVLPTPSVITAVQAPPKAHHNAGGTLFALQHGEPKHGAAHARPVNTNVTRTPGLGLWHTPGARTSGDLSTRGRASTSTRGFKSGWTTAGFHGAVTLKRCTSGLRGASTASFNRTGLGLGHEVQVGRVNP